MNFNASVDSSSHHYHQDALLGPPLYSPLTSPPHLAITILFQSYGFPSARIPYQ